MPVSFAHLDLAFMFVSASAEGENQRFVDRQSGKFYFDSDVADVEEDEKLPPDIEDEKYVEIPHRNELGLGKPLVLDFVDQFLPDDYDEVRQIFSRRGAYARFKALLARRNALQQWYDFSAKAEKEALLEWGEESGIELSD
jgi:uncharacterized protein UPF0158